MKNYLREIFSDILLSIVTKKYGTSLNDYQREEKADEIIQELHDNNIGGTPVYALVKEGMFHKVKICYFITRNKDTIDGPYLEKIYEELRKQAIGENIFHSSEFKQG